MSVNRAPGALGFPDFRRHHVDKIGPYFANVVDIYSCYPIEVYISATNRVTSPHFSKLLAEYN